MNHLNRDIGLVGLTFVAVGGMIGSGWLFVPLNAAQAAGGAALLAWLIGAVAMLLLALTFAEISAMLPVAGGIATVPYLCHGTVTSMIVGWTAWIGYNTAAPIEVEAMLRYLDPVFPWLYGETPDTGLTAAGHVAATIILAFFVVVNAFGVRLFARINTSITWAKIAIPLIVGGVLIYSQFSIDNFTAHGGFSPKGIDGVLAAVSAGGVIFAMIGFRHAIDLAGEVRNPRVTIPLALTLSVVICFFIYGFLQIAFIGAVPAERLAGGWENLQFTGKLGPLGAIAASVGIVWLVSLINFGAVVSPFGGALVSVGSNARLALALSYNGFLPAVFQRLSVSGVPLYTLLLNFVIGVLLLNVMPFDELLALNSALLVLSLALGPVALVALRALAPDLPRSFRLPAATVVATVAFMIATLVIYWSGWNTIWRMAIALAIGLAIMAVRLRHVPAAQRDMRSALWLLPFVAGVLILSKFSPFGGGTGDIGHGWGLLVVGSFGLAIFILAQSLRLPAARFATVLVEVRREMAEEEGAPPTREAK